jgi:hypothetical protein
MIEPKLGEDLVFRSRKLKMILGDKERDFHEN